MMRRFWKGSNNIWLKGIIFYEDMIKAIFLKRHHTAHPTLNLWNNYIGAGLKNNRQHRYEVKYNRKKQKKLSQKRYSKDHPLKVVPICNSQQLLTLFPVV